MPHQNVASEISASTASTGSTWDCVGNTPLIEIQSLSRLTGCRIFGKAEFMNPGGSVKDRAAKGIIIDA